MRRLQFVKSKLKEWNREMFGDLKESKDSILKEIVEIETTEQERNLTA